MNLAGVLCCHYCNHTFLPQDARSICSRDGRPLDIQTLTTAISQAHQELDLPRYDRKPEDDPRYLKVANPNLLIMIVPILIVLGIRTYLTR